MTSTPLWVITTMRLWVTITSRTWGTPLWVITTMSYTNKVYVSPQDNEGKANLETVAPKDVPPSNLLRISEEIIVKWSLYVVSWIILIAWVASLFPWKKTNQHHITFTFIFTSMSAYNLADDGDLAWWWWWPCLFRVNNLDHGDDDGVLAFPGWTEKIHPISCRTRNPPNPISRWRSFWQKKYIIVTTGQCPVDICWVIRGLVSSLLWSNVSGQKSPVFDPFVQFLLLTKTTKSPQL